MRADQDLDHAVGDQLMQGEQLAMSGGNGFGIAGVHGFSAGFQRVGGFFDDRDRR